MVQSILKTARKALSKFRRVLRDRKPASRFWIVFLSGDSVMVWTEDGNVVLSRDAARSLAEVLSN